MFQSLTSFNYTVAVVKDSFANDTTWSLATAEKNRVDQPGWVIGPEDHVILINPPDWDFQAIITDMQRAAATEQYIIKNVSQCFDLYNHFFAPQGNVLVYVKNESVQIAPTDSLLLYAGIIPRRDGWLKNLWALSNSTNKWTTNSPAYPVEVWYVGEARYEVDHCMVQLPALATSVCRFEYSPWIMWTVCSFNSVKFCVMCSVWYKRRSQARASKLEHWREQVIYTLGDAIASFMRHTEPKTKNMCLATSDDQEIRGKLLGMAQSNSVPRPWTNEPRRWGQAASRLRWTVLLAMWVIRRVNR